MRIVRVNYFEKRREERKSERFEPLLNAYVIKITPVTIREC